VGRLRDAAGAVADFIGAAFGVIVTSVVAGLVIGAAFNSETVAGLVMMIGIGGWCVIALVGYVGERRERRRRRGLG
jgi:hypothetical protein